MNARHIHALPYEIRHAATATWKQVYRSKSLDRAAGAAFVEGLVYGAFYSGAIAPGELDTCVKFYRAWFSL